MTNELKRAGWEAAKEIIAKEGVDFAVEHLLKLGQSGTAEWRGFAAACVEERGHYIRDGLLPAPAFLAD